jgi:methylmalonyl-CoA mutase N-terminal domain/subunit
MASKLVHDFIAPPVEETVAEAEARWRRGLYEPAIAAKGERRRFELDCGIAVEPLYTPAKLAAQSFDFARDVGFPGEYPFTRGDSPAMYRSEPFVVSAYSGFGEATECNRRFRKLIELGVEQLLVAFDLPTQCGYDSDHLMSAGEVGKVGVSIDTLADMELLFDGIPLDSVKRVGTLGNSIGPIVTAMFAALGEKHGIDRSRYVVNLQNDPLKEYLARGTQILPAAPAARLAMDAVAWCVDHAPNWSPCTVCYNHLNAGGGGSTWGAAIALANAVDYIETLLKRGLRIDDVAPLFHMFPDERHDFFTSVANLRALRRVWARLMRERFGAVDPRSMALRTTVYGHGQETLQEPLNNVVRIAFGTLAYVLGGASYVYIASYDEAVGTPTEDTVKVAIRTQQIIAHEHGITDTIDPLGGSYFVESLTLQIAEGMWNGLEQIMESGGALRVIDSGFGREIMNRGAIRRQQRIDSGDRPWVTVNVQPQKPNVPNTAFRMDPGAAARQVERTQRIRRERDNARVERALAAVDAACAADANVMPAVLDAVRAYATVGEIVAVWRARYGTFEPSTSF